MSQNKGLVSMIQTKLKLMSIQKAELQNVLDGYVQKQTDSAEASLQTEGQNVNSLRTVNSSLETALNLLFKTYENFEGASEDSPQFHKETAQNVITSTTTEKSQVDSPIAVELNRRLELLEIVATFQDEQNRNLMSAQERQQRSLEEQARLWKDSLKDVETRRTSEMLAMKLQRDDMEDSLTSLTSNVKSLLEVTKEQDNRYSDAFVDKKLFCDVLEQTVKTEKLVEQLAGSLEAAEFDVQNVMDWHKALEKECKVTNAKVAEIKFRVQGCMEKLGQEEKNLTILTETVQSLEERGMRELKPLKESYETVNQALHLTCRLVAVKLLPLDRLRNSLNNQLRNMSSSRLFQSKATERFDECEKELGTLKQKLEQQDSSIATTAMALRQDVLKQRKACKDDWTSALQRLKVELEKDDAAILGVYHSGNTTLNNTIKEISQRLDLWEHGASTLKNRLDQHDKSLSLSAKDATLKRYIAATSVELKGELEGRLDQMNVQSERKIKEMVLDHLQTMKMEIMSARGQTSSAGFTACLEGYRNFMKDDIVKPYKLVSLENDSFDVYTGEFEAPSDGTYLSLFTLMQAGEGKITAHVCRLPSANRGLKLVCKTLTKEDEGTSSAAGYIHLAAGEMLAIRIISMSGTAKLSPYTFFTCCLVGS